MKKLLSIALAATMMISLISCSKSAESSETTTTTPTTTTTATSDNTPDPEPAADPIVIKAGHHTAIDGSFQFGLEAFRDKLEELSGGAMLVEIYPAGQLGDQTEMIQQLQTNTIQMSISSCADLANFAPLVGVLDVPYMFETKTQAWNAMNGEAGEFLSDYVNEEAGVLICGWWSGGTRSVFSSIAPVNTVDDMTGLKIRSQPAEVHVNSFSAMGATVVPIAYTELYSALQQNLVDAAENDPSNYYSMKFYEVCKYYSLTEHIQQVAGSPVMVSVAFYDSLTDEQRGWFDEAAAYAEDTQRQQVEDAAADYIALLEGEGVIVNEVDKASFMEAMEPFYESYVYPTYGEELVSLIQSFPSN